MGRIVRDSQQIAFTGKRTFLGSAAAQSTPLPPRSTPRGSARGRKGKSGNQTAIEAPNTLQSHVLVGVIDLLGEGPIGGLVNGGQSIYFNNMPLLNTSNAYNFKGCTWQLRTGTPDQTMVSGFPSADNTVEIGTLVSHLAPVDFEITNTDCNRAAVTVEIPALYLEDTKNGNINAYYIKVMMTVTPEGGTAQTVVNDQINGKCTSPYQRTYTFDLPGTGPWTIAISRPNADSTTVTIQDQWYVSAVDEIVDWPMIYPHCAYVAITFDSEYFGSTLPTRTYDIQGLIISIPANYNPTTRAYATTGTGTSGGTWDGITFANAVTDNPAWVVYDLISNNRYGMGLASSALSLTKWDCYQIGQYCDELVPDGFGGTEPRFRCNVSITSRDDAYRVLQSLVAIFRGMAYWGSGTVRLTSDMPTPVTKLVNQADVIDGNFTYEGTSIKTRHTMAIVSYLEPKDYWQPTPIVYQNPDLLVLNTVGPQLLSVNAIGATTAGQAYRQAVWLISAESICTDTVTYQCGLDHLGVVPGDVIAISDPAYAGLRTAGRFALVAYTEDTWILTLDQSIVPEEGVTYAISFVLIDGTLAQDVVIESWTQNSATSTTVVVAPQGATGTEAGAIWIMTSSLVSPRQFRVIGVTEPQPGTMEVTALYHDPNIYELVDYGIDLADNPFSVLAPLQTEPITSPTGVQADSYFQGEGTTTVLVTSVGWTPPADLRVISYDVQAYSDQGYQNSWNNVPGPTYDIPNLPIANYVFGVRSRTQTAATSGWAFSAETLINGTQPVPPTPAGLTALGATRSIALSWEPVVLYNLLYYVLQRAPVTGGVTGSFSTIANVAATSYVDSNSVLLTPLTEWAYQVAATDTLLNTGDFCTPVQATTTQLVTNDLTLESVSNYAAVSVTSPVAGTGSFETVLTATITNTDSNSRSCMILLDAKQAYSGSGSCSYEIIWNSATVDSRGAGATVDFVAIMVSTSLVAGANSLTVKWSGDTTLTLEEISVIVFARAV